MGVDPTHNAKTKTSPVPDSNPTLPTRGREKQKWNCYDTSRLLVVVFHFFEVGIEDVVIMISTGIV